MVPTAVSVAYTPASNSSTAATAVKELSRRYSSLVLTARTCTDDGCVETITAVLLSSDI